MTVLLNVDLGELPGEPDELYALAHVANVACGGHAGDAASMRHAVDRSRALGAALGAHPSFPDREGFGRRPVVLSPEALRAEVAAQCARLAAIAAEVGAAVRFVKPHGALYHAADRDTSTAAAVVQAARDALGTNIRVIGPPGGRLSAAAASAGLGYAREGFADRGVGPDGRLLPRGSPGALVVEPEAAARQARSLVAGGGVDTICVHGDSPGAVDIARAVRHVLDSAGQERA